MCVDVNSCFCNSPNKHLLYLSRNYFFSFIDEPNVKVLNLAEKVKQINNFVQLN